MNHNESKRRIKTRFLLGYIMGKNYSLYLRFATVLHVMSVPWPISAIREWDSHNFSFSSLSLPALEYLHFKGIPYFLSFLLFSLIRREFELLRSEERARDRFTKI